MHYDEEVAVELSNRINDIMRELPPGTQPATVLTALSAVLARLLTSLREEDRAPAFEYAMKLVREHSGIRTQ